MSFSLSLWAMEPEVAPEAQPVEQPLAFAWGASGRQGRRSYMEDLCKVKLELGEDSQHAFFGIFDGHAGGNAARVAGELLPQVYLNIFQQTGSAAQALHDAFLIVDQKILESIEEAGTTALTAVINHGIVLMTWVGDSRGLIISDSLEDGFAATIDHKPDSPFERLRIEQMGGTVEFRNGAPRLNGTLAMSRALGDKSIKNLTPGALIAQPDLLGAIVKPGDIIFMASDGFWDKFPDNRMVAAEVAQLVNAIQPQYIFPIRQSNPANPGNPERWFEAGNSEVLKALATYFRNNAYGRGSGDNITVMIIQVLPAFQLLPVQ
jgi:serine/threonine protein phosphatase PrpC